MSRWVVSVVGQVLFLGPVVAGWVIAGLYVAKFFGWLA